MLKLNSQAVEKNGMGVAWMLGRNGKAIPVKIHVYGALGDLDSNVEAALWMLANAPYPKLRTFLKQYVGYMALNEVPWTDDEAAFKEKLKKVLLDLPYNPGKQAGLSKEDTVDFLMSLVDKMSVDEIYDLGESVNDNTGDFVCKDLNETFIRVRMGGEYNTDRLTGDTYFRIGSTYKDWTDAIYMFVHDHPNAKTIFVERDAESDGKEGLNTRDVMINGMPREEFLSAEKLPFLGSRHNSGILGTVYSIISKGNYSDLDCVRANSSRIADMCQKLKVENLSCNYKTIEAPWADKPRNR